MGGRCLNCNPTPPREAFWEEEKVGDFTPYHLVAGPQEDFKTYFALWGVWVTCFSPFVPSRHPTSLASQVSSSPLQNPATELRTSSSSCRLSITGNLLSAPLPNRGEIFDDDLILSV